MASVNRIWLYIIVFLVLSIFVCAQTTIYDKIKEIKSNPKAYTMVIGKSADVEEIKHSSELLRFLRLSKSKFDTDVNVNENLVIIGLPETNSKVAAEVGGRLTGMLIQVKDSNLIVAGSNANNLKNAVEKLKAFEENKAALSKEKIPSMDMFSPLSALFSNMLIVYIVAGLFVLGGSTALVVGHKGHNKAKTASSPMQGPEYIQLRSYIAQAMQMGYTEQQLRASLIQVGWQKQVLDAVFKELRSL